MPTRATPRSTTRSFCCDRALRELSRVRAVTFDAAGRTVRVVTRRNALQSRTLAALGVATGDWDRARIR